MSNKTILELAEENQELKAVMTQLGWKAPEPPKAPTLMDKIEHEEELCLITIVEAIKACEAQTGRPVTHVVHKKLVDEFEVSSGLPCHAAYVSLSPRTARVVEVYQSPQAESLRDLLTRAGAKAAMGSYDWGCNYKTFLSWAQNVMRRAFEDSKNASTFK